MGSRGHLNSSLENVSICSPIECFGYNVREFCNNNILPPLNEILLLEALTYFSTSRNGGERNHIFPFFSLEGPYITLIPIFGNTDSSERSFSTKETYTLSFIHIHKYTHTHIFLRLIFSFYFLFLLLSLLFQLGDTASFCSLGLVFSILTLSLFLSPL